MTSAWYSEEAGFFGHQFLDEYRSWMTPQITETQVAFATNVLELHPGSNVLDLACGNGRHTMGLSRLGFRVTGMDLNQSYIRRAAAAARDSGLEARWVTADMRQIPFENEFNAVLSLFTSFGFFPEDEEDAAVIEQVARSLRPHGRFILDVMNRRFVLRNLKKEEHRRQEDGSLWKHYRDFDPSANRLRHLRVRIGTADESRWESVVRLYSPEDLDDLCLRAGLRIQHVYGGYALEPWGFEHPRTIVVAGKG